MYFFAYKREVTTFVFQKAKMYYRVIIDFAEKGQLGNLYFHTFLVMWLWTKHLTSLLSQFSHFVELKELKIMSHPVKHQEYFRYPINGDSYHY